VCAIDSSNAYRLTVADDFVGNHILREHVRRVDWDQPQRLVIQVDHQVHRTSVLDDVHLHVYLLGPETYMGWFDGKLRNRGE